MSLFLILILINIQFQTIECSKEKSKNLLTTNSKTNTETNSKSEAKAKAESESNSSSSTSTQIKTEAKTSNKNTSKVSSTTNSEAKLSSKSENSNSLESNFQVHTSLKTNSESMLKAKAKSESKSQSSAKSESEAESESKSQTELESNLKSEAKNSLSNSVSASATALSSANFKTKADFKFKNLNQNKIQSKSKSSKSFSTTKKLKFFNSNSFKNKSKNKNRNKSKNKNKHRSYNSQPSTVLGKLPKGNAQAYWEGWVSYLHYNGPLKKIHKKLFKNTEFFHQRLPVGRIKKKDKFGSMMIPNQSKFFMVLNKNSLQFFTSRRFAYKNQWDTLEIRHIKPIPEDKIMKGGVHDLVKKIYGYCFDLRVVISKERKTWLICLNDKKEKAKLIKQILRLKIAQQRKKGKFETQDTIKLRKKKAGLSKALCLAKKKDKITAARSKAGKPLDGRWILLWDWSECSLKCGGGTSHQQWQCIPPKNGGKPCEGKAIRWKPCNPQPCPNIMEAKKLVKQSKQIAKPIIKVGAFSHRLQRYEKCVVKDNDAYSAKMNPKTKILSKIPVRLVMNNYTITIYKDDEYEDIERSYKLSQSRVYLAKGQNCCFKITNEIHTSMVCGYDKFCGNENDNKWANEWIKHFGLFRNSCRQGRFKLLTGEDEEKLKKALKKKISGGMAAMQRKRAKNIKQRMVSSFNKKNPLKKVHEEGFKALQKELMLEKLIRQEEKEREDIEANSIIEKIKVEKEKRNCLNRNIKEKKLDVQILNERRNLENEAKQFKKDMTQKVLKNRKNFKKMISDMRAKARIRKAALAQQLQAVRAKMAADMERANKMGDMKKCLKGKTNKDYRSVYCDKVYVQDFIRNEDCKTDNFCYVCCEHEFGNMHVDIREKCYNACDGENKKKKKKKNKGEGKFGRWEWIG